MNKKVAQQVASIPSKRLRNKIAGFVTHLMNRIQKGSVRGISLRLQEAERERKQDLMPERSITEVDTVYTDADTMEMIKHLGCSFSVKEQVVESRGGRNRNFQNNRSTREPRNIRQNEEIPGNVVA